MDSTEFEKFYQETMEGLEEIDFDAIVDMIKYISPVIHQRATKDLRRELYHRKQLANVTDNTFQNDIIFCIYIYFKYGPNLEEMIRKCGNSEIKKRLIELKLRYNISSKLQDRPSINIINLRSFTTIYPILAAEVLTKVDENKFNLTVSPKEIREHVPNFPIVLMSYSTICIIPKEDTQNRTAHEAVLNAIRFYLGFEVLKCNKKFKGDIKGAFRRSFEISNLAYNYGLPESTRQGAVQTKIFEDVYEIGRNGQLSIKPEVEIAANKYKQIYSG